MNYPGLHQNVTPRSEKREIRRLKLVKINENTAYTVIRANYNFRRVIAFRNLVNQVGFAEALFISNTSCSEKENAINEIVNQNLSLQYEMELTRLLRENKQLRIQLDQERRPKYGFSSEKKQFTCSTIGCSNRRIKTNKPGSIFYHCRNCQTPEFKNKYFCCNDGCNQWKQRKPIPYNMCSCCIIKEIKSGFYSIKIE